MASISAVLQTPNGRREPVRLSHVSTGKYNASYQTTKPGNYNLHVSVTSKTRHSSKESFSFTVQAPPPPPPRPQPVITHPHSAPPPVPAQRVQDRKSTRLNSSHEWTSYAVFCLQTQSTA